MAEAARGVVGFVTVDPNTGYLDQIVVATDQHGRGVADALLAEAMLILDLLYSGLKGSRS